MDSRSRVAAATAAVIPFSCVICFDEFSADERLPMVLPCGHTFVCLQCTKRLKRCMECREPLFLPGSTPKPTPSTPQRYGRRSLQQPPLTPTRGSPTPSMPLPIPKNVVLLAMMEAAGRQQQPQQLEDDAEEDQFDLNRIISGMATMSGPTGTYKVQDTVTVVPVDPRSNEEKKDTDDNTRTLVKGQSVQVVDFEDGVARLARDAGFIVANSSQLVKGNWNCRGPHRCFVFRPFSHFFFLLQLACHRIRVAI